MATMAQNFTNEQQQTIDAAIKKIDCEAESVSGQQVPAIAIYNFIKEKCTEDVVFAEKVLIETKKLSKCFDHIMKIAYNRAKARHNLTKEKSVGVGMSSEEIMELVVDYYNLDDAAIAKKEAEDKAFLLKLRDVVKAALDETRFMQTVGELERVWCAPD